MSDIKIGDKVKMSEELKKGMIANGSGDHIKEFGDCEGYVEENEDGICDFEVRWEPSRLRYGYDEKDLVKVVDMNRTREEILAPYVETPFTHTKIVEKDNALKAMEIFGNQEAERRERLAYRKGLNEAYEHKDKEIKELEAQLLEPKDWEPKQDSKLMEHARRVIELEQTLKKFEDEINQRIAHLISVDAEFCKDRWDDSKPQMERNIYREMSNQVTATRQELQMLKKNLGIKENNVAPDMSVRDIAAESYKIDMAAFAEGCGKPFNTLAWHVFKRAFDIASYRLKLPKKDESEEILARLKNNNPVPIEVKQSTEYILCSAVNWKGKIICGRRHKDCYNTADALMGSGFLERERKHQGFMTSTGRFVDRTEAFIIAKANNQIVHKMFDNDSTGSLTSEDLFGVED
jgi:hypothetical protein